MNKSPHQKSKEIFLKACELPQEGRDDFLAAACENDSELLQIVQDLINNDESLLNPSPPFQGTLTVRRSPGMRTSAGARGNAGRSPERR